jgi:methyl-accepting chemotaxis protein
VLVLVLIVALIGTVIVVETNSVLSREIEHDQKQDSRSEAEQVETWFASMNRQVDLIAQADQFQQAQSHSRPWPNVKTFMGNQIDKLPSEAVALHYVKFNDEHAFIRTSSRDDYFSMDRTLDASWINRSAYSGRQYWSKPFASELTNNKSMVFVSMIPGTEDQAVVLLVDLEHASNRINEPENGRSFTANSDGTILLSTDRSDIGADVTKRGYLPSSVQQKGHVGTETTRYLTNVSYAGQRYSTGVTYSDRYNLVVASQMPVKTAFSLQNKIQFSILFLIGGVLVGGVVVVGLFGYTTVRDIRKLSSKAAKISEGDFGTSLETDRRDEIGDAYKSVNEMRNELQAEIEKAEQAAAKAKEAEAQQKQVVRQQQELTEKLTTNVDEFTDAIEDASEGDLTVRLDDSTDVDQLNDLAREFNNMMDSIQEFLQQTKLFSKVVAAESSDVTEVGNEVREKNDLVVEWMDDLKDEISKQHSHLMDVDDRMVELSETTNQISGDLVTVADLSDQTTEAGESGRAAAEQTIEAIDRVTEESEAAVNEIDALETKMNQIVDIIEVIEDIADETNILALNASIEASRSGGQRDDGSDGFRIIADEIKTLATETKESTTRIEEQLQELQSQTKRAASEVEQTQAIIGESVETITNASDALKRIAENAEQTNEEIQAITAATQQQATSADEIMQMVNESASISEQAVEEVESASEAAESQSEAVYEISNSVENLHERAESLNELLEAFDVGELDRSGSTPSLDVEGEVPARADGSGDRK